MPRLSVNATNPPTETSHLKGGAQVGEKSKNSKHGSAGSKRKKKPSFEQHKSSRNRTNNLTMGMCDDLSHCKMALAFAVLMDLLGGVSLLVGVFVSLEIKGQEFGDFLVYSGVLLVVASLAGWVLWYSGNIEGLSPEKELGQISSAVDRIARRLSRKIFSHRKHLNYSQSSCV